MSDIDYRFGDYDDAPESGDNRSEYRLTASASVTLELESPIPEAQGDQSGRTLVSRTRDVSARGIRLTTAEPVIRGALLPAWVTLDDDNEPFGLMAEVVWCRASTETSWLVGLQILESDDTSYLEWVEAVAKAMSEG